MCYKNAVSKRAVILSVADLRHMTCANFFCEYFTKRGIDFDFICLNRYENEAKTIYKCNVYQYKSILYTTSTYFEKMKIFYKFREYTNNILKREKYDFIVVWGENAAWLFNKTLKTQKSYCVNIRDYLEGKNKIFKPILKEVLRRACFSTVPSPRAIDYLGMRSFLMLNKDFQVLRKYGKKKCFHKTDSRIRLTYMGVIEDYIETFKKILLIFKNDDRFILAYYGKDADVKLKQYAEQNDIKNVIFGGAFSPEKTATYLEDTDIINSIYGDENTGVKDAIGVKESYAPLLHIPVLSDCGGLFSELSEKYGFGKGIKIDLSMPDLIYNWYIQISEEQFDRGCQKYCEWVDKTNHIIENALDYHILGSSK